MAAGPGAPTSPSPFNAPGALPMQGSNTNGSLTLNLSALRNDGSPSQEFQHGRSTSVGR